MINLICPSTQQELINKDNAWQTKDGLIKYSVDQNVVKFLQKQDEFYEGSYLNRVQFMPGSENLLRSWPLWLISNGYIWEVRKQFKPKSTLLELGCASGVDYFGSRYNMIGLDLSCQSLKGLHNYSIGLQADATNLPLPDHSVDGVISSYFWEHIPPTVKDQMLEEFKRVLKPGGKIVFLYDVETDNSLVGIIKKNNPARYQALFLDGDGHLGYETPAENFERFRKHELEVIKHFGMERTWFQSNSVFDKLSGEKGFIGFAGSILKRLTSGKVLGYTSILMVRFVDVTLGRFYSLKKSRIIISVLKLGK